MTNETSPYLSLLNNNAVVTNCDCEKLHHDDTSSIGE